MFTLYCMHLLQNVHAVVQHAVARVGGDREAHGDGLAAVVHQPGVQLQFIGLQLDEGVDAGPEKLKKSVPRDQHVALVVALHDEVGQAARDHVVRGGQLDGEHLLLLSQLALGGHHVAQPRLDHG